MRFAILLSLAACLWAGATARADDAMLHVVVGKHDAYIIPESYALAYKADLTASMPGLAKIDGFWTPPLQDVTVADRAMRDVIHAAAKDPAVLFPDLAPDPDPNAAPDDNKTREREKQRAELALISENYETYARQYLGVIIDGTKYVYCNYSDGTKVDPATGYVFIQKTFVNDGTVHFLQCRFEPLLKQATNVSFVGSWQGPVK